MSSYNISDLIFLKKSCSNCGGQRVKNPNCGTDYYPCEGGITLQDECLKCGVMQPPVEGKDVDYISENRKKRILIRIARAFGFDYKQTKKIIFITKNIHDEFPFFIICSKKLDIPLYKIQQIAY